MEAEVRRLKIELDVYSKTFAELRKKIVEAEDKQRTAESRQRAAEEARTALEAEMADLRKQMQELQSQGTQQPALEDLEQELQQRLDKAREEIRIQWNIDHKVRKL